LWADTNSRAEKRTTAVGTSSQPIPLSASGGQTDWRTRRDARHAALAQLHDFVEKHPSAPKVFVQRDRGAHELQLVQRLGLGQQGWDLLTTLTEADLADLCRRQSAGSVSDDELEEIKLRHFRDAGNRSSEVEAAAAPPSGEQPPPAARSPQQPAPDPLPAKSEALVPDEAGKQMLLLQKWGAKAKDAKARVEKWHASLAPYIVADAFASASRRMAGYADRRRWLSKQMKQALRDPNYRVPSRSRRPTDRSRTQSSAPAACRPTSCMVSVCSRERRRYGRRSMQRGPWLKV
jgi:hypothetical protein